MDSIFNALRPFLARWVGALVAAFSGWLSTKIGIEIDPESQGAFIQMGVFIAFIVYSTIHKLIDKKVNPGDAASAPLAVAEVKQDERLSKEGI